MRFLLIAGLCLWISTGFAQNLNDGLIVYYPFDGNTRDSSLHQLHGITNAEFVADFAGNPGQALHFNGFDQYFDFPANQPLLKPELPVSFAYWIKFDTISAYYGTVFTTDFDQDNHSGTWMCLSADNGTIGISYGCGAGTTGPDNRRTKVGSSTLQAHRWYFVIGIVRESMDMDIYINCINDGGSYSGYGEALAYTDCQGNLGRKDGNVYYPPYYLKGTLDEFRYWNRALTEEDILILCEEHPLLSGTVIVPPQLSVRENPVKDYLYLDYSCHSPLHVFIADASGKVVLVSEMAREINVAGLPGGIYFIRCMDEKGETVASARFIKL